MAQSNPKDFTWSLLEHPQATAMVPPEPQWITFRAPVRIVLAGSFSDGLSLAGTLPISGSGYYPVVISSESGTNFASFGLDTFGTYQGTTAFVTVNAGTDSILSLALGVGNIDTYNLFNYTDPQAISLAVFGTHFFAVVPFAAGSNAGTFSLDTFGTHFPSTIFQDTGTGSGTFSLAAFGTALQVVLPADAGTNSGTWTMVPFGTAIEVTVHAGTYFNGGTLTYFPFGQYTLGS